MAQLRDIKTGECVAQGTVDELILVARDVGEDQVVFDDVGPDFDVEAARASYDARVADFEAASKTRVETATTASRATAKQEFEELTALDAGDAATVRERIEQARERSQVAASYE